MVVTLERHIDQRNGILSTEINAHVYVQVIFDKDTKTIQWGNDFFFQQTVDKNWISTCK